MTLTDKNFAYLGYLMVRATR